MCFQASSTMLPSTAATHHMWLFKFTFKEIQFLCCTSFISRAEMPRVLIVTTVDTAEYKPFPLCQKVLLGSTIQDSEHPENTVNPRLEQNVHRLRDELF